MKKVITPAFKENRIEKVRALIKAGSITTLDEIFHIIPKNDIIKGTKINYTTLTSKLRNPGRFTYKDARRIANVLGVDLNTISQLILKQMAANQQESKRL